jgi:DNA-binding NtrC family response regulator
MPATILVVDDDHTWSTEHLVGRSPALLELRETVQRLAQGPATPVLFIGETGTGRSLSDRRSHPFRDISCTPSAVARLDPAQIESPRGGTLFLSGAHHASVPLQQTLLRVLNDRVVHGDTSEDTNADVWIMASSDSRLDDAVERGTFARELYARLSAAIVRVPPLRARTSDIEPLVQHYVDLFNGELGTQIERVAPDALEALKAYAWPGNIRELRVVIERAMLVADGDLLHASHLALRGTDHRDGADLDLPPSGVNLERLERKFVIQALQRTGGNQTRAATLLGLNRDQVRYRIEKFGLPRT